jgi:vacuolar iron transporter family protein
MSMGWPNMCPSARKPTARPRIWRALRDQPSKEKSELAHIYEDRGVQPKLAEQVADQFMAKDALDPHARDELAWKSAPSPNRSQAASASALAFSPAPRRRR